MRPRWNHTHGVTNVWSEPAVRGAERLKDHNAQILHGNQKPLRLIERIIRASSDPEDVVWEPFGGLCSIAVASLRTGRRCYSAERIGEYYQLAKARLEQKDVIAVPKQTESDAIVSEIAQSPVLQETFFTTYKVGMLLQKRASQASGIRLHRLYALLPTFSLCSLGLCPALYPVHRSCSSHTSSERVMRPSIAIGIGNTREVPAPRRRYGCLLPRITIL